MMRGRSGPIVRALRSSVGGAAVLAASASLAIAHDFWLVPVGDEIHGISGSTFPVSENAVAPERLAEAVAVHGGGRAPLTVVGPRGPVLVLTADPALRGPLWATVAIAPRRIDLGADDFNEYLRHDGLPQVLREREERGELNRPAVERYQKYAKALIPRPGDAGPLAAAVGHRFELVPEGGASHLRAGDTLTLDVRFEGHPAPGLTVHAGFAGQPEDRHAQTHVSDAAGRVRIPLTGAGSWYARTIHMRRIAEPPFEWESFWASITFPVR
jgi:hypothetical protein